VGTQYRNERLVSVEDAQQLILGSVQPLQPECVNIEYAYGRVLAEDIASDIDISPFDSSGMDGFAVRLADVAQANLEHPVELPIAGVIGAGAAYGQSLQPGQALRIMTGTLVPVGTDAVIPLEKTEVLGETPDNPTGERVRISLPPAPGANIRKAGEEAKAGEVLLHAGELLTPAAIGLLASAGHGQVRVHRKPRLTVLATGSELVEAGVVPGPGQIRNSNGPALIAQAAMAGADTMGYRTVPDDLQAVTAALDAAVQVSDVVVLSGGAAEGDFDYTGRAAAALGEVVFTKVNMKPGKAQMFARIAGKPVLGLAGNPAAAAVGFEVLLRPALRRLQGFSDGLSLRPCSQAVLTQEVKKKEGRRFYQRARLEKGADGQLYVTPARKQSSALLGALHHSNCLLVVPEGEVGLKAGQLADCLRIDLPEGSLVA
jgi:molybdopterin molybdotransferase